jgi:uncharacterized repeat protein (TIGR03803 family)
LTAQTFTTLHSFTGTLWPVGGPNSDGAAPKGTLLLSGSTLYGTAGDGGSSGNGTVFAVNTDGSGFTNLHSFTGSDGGGPEAGLILSGNTLYGTTAGGVFAVNTDGSAFTSLLSFTVVNYDSATGSYTNSDGANPQGTLLLSSNTLYGTAELAAVRAVARCSVFPSGRN